MYIIIFLISFCDTVNDLFVNMILSKMKLLCQMTASHLSTWFVKRASKSTTKSYDCDCLVGKVISGSSLIKARSDCSVKLVEFVSTLTNVYSRECEGKNNPEISLIQFIIKNTRLLLEWFDTGKDSRNEEETNFSLCFFCVLFISINLPLEIEWSAEWIIIITTVITDYYYYCHHHFDDHEN